MQEYFMIAVSNRENLEKCKRYAYAGFPDTINGVWAYVDIKVGDYVTFLYGARAHNLYQVIKKEAILNAENLPPWKPIYFKESRKVCSFPFRLRLKPIREFNEPLARQEFSYVAENLLQRGGYWKTHFQADQTTLLNVSKIGNASDCAKVEPLELPSHKEFTPKFQQARKPASGIYQFREVILQSVIRQHLLRHENFECFLEEIGLQEFSAREFEVLGEKALPEGYIDIIAKEWKAVGKIAQIIIEVKLRGASRKDVTQLERYIDEIGEECIAGILIAERIPRALRTKKAENEKIRLMTYKFDGIDLKHPRTFEELVNHIKIESLKTDGS